MIAKKLTYSKRIKVQKKYNSEDKAVIIKMNAPKFHRQEVCKLQAQQFFKAI